MLIGWDTAGEVEVGAAGFSGEDGWTSGRARGRKDRGGEEESMVQRAMHDQRGLMREWIVPCKAIRSNWG